MKITEANKILEVALTKDIKMDKATATKIAAAKAKFFEYYNSRPRAFIEDYIKILHGKTNEECDFILNEAQRSLVDAMGKKKWVAAPKARQLGITTLTNALALHHSLFVSNANVICMAMKTDNANENLRRIKTMFKTLPAWVQKLTMDWDEAKGHQNNMGLWSFRSKLTNTSNKLEVSSAASEDATRGKTPTMMHWTEVAFSPAAGQIFTSVFPALNRRSDSVIVLESTGNGNSGFYYEVCTKIRKGFEVVFMPWFMDPEYKKDGDELSEQDLEYIKDLMGVSEFPEGLSEAQLRWYRDTSEVTGKAKCQQEYPVSVEQVFQATNSSFFSFQVMQKLGGNEPLHYLSYDGNYLQQRALGPGEVYQTPNPEYEYLMSVDPTEGSNDPAVIMIFDPDGNEVLFWREKMPPEGLIRLVDALGKQYNMASLLIESNGVGIYVLNSLLNQFMYPNVMFFQGKPGLMTNGKTKPEACAMLQDFITSDRFKINNSMLAHEMSTFEAETLRAVKGDDYHDDVVLASAIAAYGFSYRPPLKKMVQDIYSDYTNDVYKTARKKSRFII